MVEHAPTPKTWDCLVCNDPYPCPPARAQLAGEMNATQLAMLGWNLLEAAVRDMPDMPGAELFARFVAWTRTAPRAEEGPSESWTGRAPVPDRPLLTPLQARRSDHQWWDERWWRQ
jgi:hypothetical protein